MLSTIRRVFGARDLERERETQEREYEMGRQEYARDLQGIVDACDTSEERDFWQNAKERLLVADGLRWAYVKRRLPIR